MKKLMMVMGLMAVAAGAWASTPTDTPTATPTDTPTVTLTPTVCGAAPQILGLVQVADTGINSTHFNVGYTAPGGSTILVVNVSLYAVVQPSVTGITYNGVPLTIVTSGSGVPGIPSGTDTDCETWYLLDPSPVIGSGVKITSSGSCQFTVAVMTFSGASGIGSYISTDYFTGVSLTASLTPTGSNSLLESFFQIAGNRVTGGTPPTTIIYQDGNFNAQPILGTISSGPAVGGSSYSIGYNFSATLSAGNLQLVEILSGAQSCNTPTVTWSPTASATPTDTPTSAASLTDTPTFTASPTASASPTVTQTTTPSNLPATAYTQFTNVHVPTNSWVEQQINAASAWALTANICQTQPCDIMIGNPVTTPGSYVYYDETITAVGTPTTAGFPIQPGTAILLHGVAGEGIWFNGTTGTVKVKQ